VYLEATENVVTGHGLLFAHPWPRKLLVPTS